jgi:transposase
LYKRLDTRGSYQWPRSAEQVKELTGQQYRWLMEGLEIEPKAMIGKRPQGRIL